MSRIHEALKKAEQERASTQGGGALPGFASAPVAEHPLVDDAPVGPATAVAAPPLFSPGMPAFASPFSLDALLAGSAQSEWTPDPATIARRAVHRPMRRKPREAGGTLPPECTARCTGPTRRGIGPLDNAG